MRHLLLRLKKLKQNLGVAYIMCPFAHGSSKEQIAESRRKGEEKYLSIEFYLQANVFQQIK